MDIQTGTPETGAVDAPASMDSVLAEFEQDTSPPEDTTASVVRELVEEAEEGHADEAADKGEETEAREDGEAEPAPEQETTAEDPTYKVKVAGEEVEVPLSELLKGYSREADYTKKTQALAEEKRGLEANLSTDYANRLKQATELFVQTDPLLAEANQIDWNALAQADPATYTQLRAAVDARMQVVGQARAEIDRVAQETAQREQAAIAEQSRIEAEALVKALPDLADQTKMADFAKSTVEYLRTSGFPDDAIAELLDHKALLVVDKARKWDAQEKARATLPSHKIVPVSAAKSMKSAASDGSTPQRRTPAPSASRDKKVNWAVQELLESQRT